MNAKVDMQQTLEALDDVQMYSDATRERTDAAAHSEEKLSPQRLSWLRGVLGLTSNAERLVTRHELAGRTKSEVPAMMLVVRELGRVVGYDTAPEELYRFRMFLNGEAEQAIGGAFRKSPAYVCEERTDFIDRLNGEGDFELTGAARERVAEARKRAIGQILGSHALDKVFGKDVLHRMEAADGTLEPSWEIHPADFIVGKVEEAMERKGMLTPGLGLLRSHFLNTTHELPNTLRNEISPALRGLSSIVKYEIIAAANHDESVETYQGLKPALDFLKGLVDHEGGVIPRGRGAYMEQWRSSLPKSENADEAARQAKEVKEKIKIDNEKLGLALSWVFDTERKQDW